MKLNRGNLAVHVQKSQYGEGIELSVRTEDFLCYPVVRQLRHERDEHRPLS
jgi:hypothetical protein